MKFLFTLLITLPLFAYSQVNYEHLDTEWCRYYPSAVNSTSDTLFFASNLEDDCLHKEDLGMIISYTELRLEFNASDSKVTISETSGSMVNPDHPVDSTTEIIQMIDSLNIGTDDLEVRVTEFTVKVPVQLNTLGPASMMHVSDYTLDQTNHTLRFSMDGKNEQTYQILLLSENKFILTVKQ